jgi:hypothetical protein
MPPARNHYLTSGVLSLSLSLSLARARARSLPPMEGDTRKEAGPHRTRAEGHTVVVIGSCANDRVASLAAAAAAAEPAADKAGSATSVRRPLHQL